MKKNIKKLILISLGLIIILVSIYIIVSVKKAKPGLLETPAINSSTQNEIIDPSIMTAEERKALHVNPSLNVEVIRRSATGTPTDYRIIQ